jgi:hypothetical protein
MRYFAALLCLILLSACHQQQTQQQRQQEEQQISPAVRAAVVAALGPHISDADLTEFLRSAKLASRTKRDAEVVGMLDEVVSLARTAAQNDNQAEEFRAESRRYSSMLPDAQTDCGGLSDVSDCEQINDINKKFDKIHHDKARQDAEAAQNLENESKQRKQQIPELVQKLQAALH